MVSRRPKKDRKKIGDNPPLKDVEEGDKRQLAIFLHLRNEVKLIKRDIGDRPVLAVAVAMSGQLGVLLIAGPAGTSGK